jgi:hypothetical protein
LLSIFCKRTREVNFSSTENSLTEAIVFIYLLFYLPAIYLLPT